jgi:N-methylhydantoinase A
MRLDRGDWVALESAFRALEQEAKAVIADAGFALHDAVVQRFADGRFLGQGHDLVVPLPPGPYDEGDAAATRAALQGAFERASREKFSRTPPDVPIVYDRLALKPGDAFEGPAVIEDEGSTLVVGPGASVTVTPSHNVRVAFS